MSFGEQVLSELEHWKAHEMATKKYNYQREAEEYYGNLKKHK